MRRTLLTFLAGAAATLLVYSLYPPSRNTIPFSEDATPEAELRSRGVASARDDALAPVAQSFVQSSPPEARVAIEADRIVEPIDPSETAGAVNRSIQNGPTLRREIEREAVDPVWAPQTEAQLRAYLEAFIAMWRLNDRYAVAGVRCRSTICELLISDGGNRNGNVASDSAAMRDLVNLYDEPWAAQFNRKGMQVVGSSENGSVQTYIYLTTRSEGDGITEASLRSTAEDER